MVIYPIPSTNQPDIEQPCWSTTMPNCYHNVSSCLDCINLYLYSHQVWRLAMVNCEHR